jgi:ribulose-5-phosphate 4-epimerase/fuculose-1-phosphate aldolase
MTPGRLHSVSSQAACSSAEWHARVDLAAAYRIAAAFDWEQLIYNHITHRVPAEPQCFLVKPHGLMFRRVTASCLVKVHVDGTVATPGAQINTAGFAIHTAVLRARPDVQAVVHVHTPAGMAISAHRSGLRYLSQSAMRFFGARMSYHDYQGVSEVDEMDAIAADLGQAKALILRNHGLLTVGPSMQEAMSRMNFLMSAVEAQLRIEATGAGNVLEVPAAMCEKAAAQWDALEANGRLEPEWPAMLDWMDEVAPGFRT